MKPEKLTISPLPPSKLAEISVLFNPNSYSITKSVRWSQSAPPMQSAEKDAGTQRKLNAPPLSFGGGDNRQLTLELFFDVSEPVLGQRDVREETSKIVKLTRIERIEPQPQPPICKIFWGRAPNDLDFPFIGVVSNLVQRFTLFSSDGTPVRATLTVTFVEFLTPEQDQRQTDPEFTTRLVKRGDSLSSIAAEVYRNAQLWRPIAEANDLDDPRHLSIGLRLNIPKLG
jgi:nucleoid-associated protein YgaU